MRLCITSTDQLCKVSDTFKQTTRFLENRLRSDMPVHMLSVLKPFAIRRSIANDANGLLFENITNDLVIT
jgi:hypothetical protein